MPLLLLPSWLQPGIPALCTAREQVHVNVSLPVGYLSTNIPLCQITSVILIGTRFLLDNIYQHLPFHSIGKLRAAKLLIYPTS